MESRPYQISSFLYLVFIKSADAMFAGFITSSC
uniref:Uncharacterized protein n=1 Tax=Populus trichocarpa TaxID=3694 RepID=A0A3N7ENJ6_POPTR